MASKTRFPWYKKINPVWWFMNADDPIVPDNEFVDQPQWLRKLKWAFRNPLHNFTFYVIGVADEEVVCYTTYPGKVFGPVGTWNIGYVLCVRTGKRYNFRSYIGDIDSSGNYFPNFIKWIIKKMYGNNVKYYIGWRERGNWGFKLIRNNDNM